LDGLRVFGIREVLFVFVFIHCVHTLLPLVNQINKSNSHQFHRIQECSVSDRVQLPARRKSEH